MISCIFIGTPEFSVPTLKALNDDGDIEVTGVYTGRDKRRSKNRMLPTPVKKYALLEDLPVYTPENINSDEVYKRLDREDPDFIVVVAYGQVIGERLLERFDDRILNVHSSLLPKYRGAAPIQKAIAEGEKETGVTIMLVDEGLDKGDILAVKKLSIGPEERADSLHDRLAEAGGALTADVLKNFDEYYRNKKEQDEKKASYAGKIDKKTGQIDFNRSPEEIYNRMRAFTPWPGAYFYYGDENVKVHNMHIIRDYNDDTNGKVIDVSEDGITVACEGGYVVFDEIQFPGKKSMDVKSYLLGNEFKEGIILNE